MKKFRLQSVKPKQEDAKVETGKSSKLVSKIQQQNERKKRQLQKQMAMVKSKLEQAASDIAQTQKKLDTDLFLKKQKQKQKQYAKNLNSQYQRQKKNQKQTGSQKLMLTSKNDMPFEIMGAIGQIGQRDNPMKKWVMDDHHIRLDEMALQKQKSQYFGQFLRKAEAQKLLNNSQNVWRRAKEVSSDCTQIKYLPVIVQQSQLQPSDYGQPLISALSLMPPALSQVLYRQYPGVDKQQYFLFKFYPGGDRKSILTDQWIEVRQYQRKQVNVNSRNRDGLTFWSTLVQKAYRKMYFDQKSPCNLLEAVTTVYGIDPQIISFDSKVAVKENWPKILSALVSNHPKAIVAFVDSKSSTQHRCYPLKNVQFPQIPKKKKKNQQPVAVPQILYHLSNPYAGKTLKSDFINKFSLTQLLNKFDKILILREYPQRWGGIRVKVEFMSNGPISITGSQWTKNNQYSFTLTKNSDVRIIMRRKWGSLFQPNDNQFTFGFMLFKSPQGDNQISCMKVQNVVCKVRNIDINGCIFTGQLAKGTYIVLPFTHNISQQYLQCFNLDILAERQQYVSINRCKLQDYYYDNIQANSNKVLQKLQSKVRYQKPKIQKIMLPQLFFDKTQGGLLRQKDIQAIGLTLSAANPADYFIPGKLKNLLVSGEITQTKKQKQAKKSAQVQEMERYQKQQALRVLLGYDVLLGQDLNQGQVLARIQQTSDEIDLSNFGLGQEGLLAVLQSLMVYPRLARIDVSYNDLTDSAITYLCYYLQKGNRNQLEQLNVTGNVFSATGIKALRALKKIYNKLQIVGAKID